MKTITTFILAGALALLAQPNQLDLRQDPPTAVQSERVSSAYTGTAGATTYYYWVVTRYPIGFIVPTSPVIVGGASALGGGNSVALGWPAMTGASSYDVLRTTTNAAPSSCTCAVVLATTGTTLTDNGGALSAWPPGGLNSAGVAQAELQINNRDAGAPYITMAVRNAQRTLNYQLGILKNGPTPSYVPSGFIQPYANPYGRLACVDSAGADCLNNVANVLDFGAVANGTTNDAAAFAAALATGKDVYAPTGYYLIQSTVTMNTEGQRLYGDGPGRTYLLKGANVIILSIDCHHCAVEKMMQVGTSVDPARPGNTNWPESVPVPAFTDSTDLVRVGISGSGSPSGWVLRDVVLSNAGRDNLLWDDGPLPLFSNLTSAFAGRWGINITQSVVLGGAAVDTHHAMFNQVHTYANGHGNYSEGGGVKLQGSAHNLANLKTYGNYGQGLYSDQTESVGDVFSEQNAAYNDLVDGWATSTAYLLGAFASNAGKLYQATNSGTSGASAPTCTTGTCSDGTIVWQFRAAATILHRSSNGQGHHSIRYLNYEASPEIEYYASAVPAQVAPLRMVATQILGSPTQRTVEVTSDTGAFFSAFTSAGGNIEAFVGQEFGSIRGATRRLWSGYHQPYGTAEGFLGTPDDVDVAIYRNKAAKFQFQNSKNVNTQDLEVIGNVYPRYTAYTIGTSSNPYGATFMSPTVFSSLGAAVNGKLMYCSDCTKATPCVGGGTGAWAKGTDGAWDCD